MSVLGYGTQTRSTIIHDKQFSYGTHLHNLESFAVYLQSELAI